LTDHMRSVLRNEMQQHGIEEFWSDKINMVRDCVLGKQTDGKRSGRLFEQNNMQIIDVDFIDASIQDNEISGLLVDSQHEAVRLKLDLERESRTLDMFLELEEIKRTRMSAAEKTAKMTADLNMASTVRAHDLKMADVNSAADVAKRRYENDVENQQFVDEIQSHELKRRKDAADLETRISEEQMKLRLEELKARTEAEEQRIKAVTPDLIAAMQVMGQSEFAAKITEELSPLAILGGESVADVASRLLGGLGLDKVIQQLQAKPEK
jgi:major vault protein